MRIGVDARELRRGTSTGIGRFVRAFLRYARDVEGHSFFLYGDRKTALEEFSWTKTRVLDAPWPLSDHASLPARLREDAVELFFSPYYKAPLLCPCPSVVAIHDLMFLDPRAGGNPAGWRARLERAAAARFARASSGVLTVSSFSKGEIVRLLSIDAGKIEVIPNAVPPSFAPADERARADALRRHGLKEGFVLYVGGFKPSKNVGALLDAYASLDSAARAAHPLVLVGPRDAHYSRFIVERGASARGLGATFLSGVSDRELIALYSSCALCVVPSLIEGFGMPALEAMACGAPVLASDRTALPEVVGDAGELCAPTSGALAEALARLLADEGRRKELGRRGLARAAGYAYRPIGERILRFLVDKARR